MRVAGREFKEGDIITIDGSTGEVMAGAVRDRAARAGRRFRHADGLGRRGPPPEGARQRRDPARRRTAREFGAEGIGLCRTEHMFFDAGAHHRGAPDDPGRGRGRPPRRARQAAARAARRLRRDLRDHGRPAGDDPPARSAAARVPAARGGTSSPRSRRRRASTVEALKRRAAELHEFNPMLGHRGCRLGITYPEIYEMQARAIFEAAVDVAEQSGAAPIPEVMIPLVATRRELELMKAVIDDAAQAVFAEKGRTHRVSGRHDDRAAARRAARRRDRRGRRVLLLRHQRPDPDHVRRHPRRRGALPDGLCREGHLREAIRSSASTSRASAS